MEQAAHQVFPWDSGIWGDVEHSDERGLSTEAEAAAQDTPVLIQQLHPAPHQGIALSWSQPTLSITAFPQAVPFPTGHHPVTK